MNYKDIYAQKAEQADALLAECSVRYEVKYVGEVNKGDWPCDQWRATFIGLKSKESFDYYTGLGLRKKSKTSFIPDKPQAPKAVDVLSSMVLDSSANDMSFKDWCAEYGGDDDSIKSLNIYQACCETAVKLSRILNRDQLAKLAPSLEDL